MKTIKITMLLTLVAVFAVACSDKSDSVQPEPPEKPIQIQMTVLAKGTASSKMKNIVHPETGVPVEATNYQLNLVDSANGDFIGTLHYSVLEHVFPSDGTFTSSVILTLDLNSKGLVVAEIEVFQEVVPPIQELNFIVKATPTDNNVIDATLDFENMDGTVSIIGKLGLSDFGEGTLHFDHLFTIDLNAN